MRNAVRTYPEFWFFYFFHKLAKEASIRGAAPSTKSAVKRLVLEEVFIVPLGCMPHMIRVATVLVPRIRSCKNRESRNYKLSLILEGKHIHVTRIHNDAGILHATYIEERLLTRQQNAFTSAFETFYLRDCREISTLLERIELPHKRRLQCAPPVCPPLIQFQQQF